MYKDFETTLVIGSTGTGKSYFMERYIKEVINDENNMLYLVDPKMVELFEFNDFPNVVYITSIPQFKEKIYDVILNDKTDKKKYLFVDEYFELKVNEEVHKMVKSLLKNKKDLNLNVVLTSQVPTAFCKGMRANSNTIINLNKRTY